MINGIVESYFSIPNYNGSKMVLKDILEKEENLCTSLLLNDIEIEKMKYHKGAKKVERINPVGIKYFYSEGKMSLFDCKEKPARTMLTSESTLNRSTHIIKTQDGRLRKISPVEAERLNGFEDN
jgi:DNA (cytosine-5)-methyltransferase 1